jgi:hypothetical protein
MQLELRVDERLYTFYLPVQRLVFVFNVVEQYFSDIVPMVFVFADCYLVWNDKRVRIFYFKGIFFKFKSGLTSDKRFLIRRCDRYNVSNRIHL